MATSRIFLIGMPGSGKTTLARQLSQITGYEALDLDELIESRAGKSVSEIFTEGGEAYFRQLEWEELRSAAGRDNMILSCGGGTPCYHDNMSFIGSSGQSVFIDTPLDVLEQRLRADGENIRPLVAAHGDNLMSYLEGLLNERRPYYERASLRWNYDDSVERLVRDLGLGPDA